MIRTQAIRNLYPSARMIRGGEALDNNDVPMVLDEAAVDAEVLRLEALATATAYQAKRAAEYPPVADYLDAVVKGDPVAQQAYIDACLAVKAKYPKV